MEAPDKIYIDIIDMDSGYMMAPSFENNGGAEYIRKDAVMEWLKEQEKEGLSALVKGLPLNGKLATIARFMDYLNSL